MSAGYDTDQGPAWVGWVRFSKTWQTAHFHGRTLRRVRGGGVRGNFYDVESGEEFWVSGPKRDRTDARFSAQQPTIEHDAQAAYEALLAGAPLPGRKVG